MGAEAGERPCLGRGALTQLPAVSALVEGHKMPSAMAMCSCEQPPRQALLQARAWMMALGCSPYLTRMLSPSPWLLPTMPPTTLRERSPHPLFSHPSGTCTQVLPRYKLTLMPWRGSRRAGLEAEAQQEGIPGLPRGLTATAQEGCHSGDAPAVLEGL